MRPTILAQLSARWFIFGCLLAFIPACSKVATGPKVTRENAAFIEPGITTHAEVVDNFGPPTLELSEPRVIAYAWHTAFGDSAPPEWSSRRPGLPGEPTSPLNKGVDDQPALSGVAQWVFCLLLDSQDRVVRTGRIRATEGSVAETVRAWALHRH